MGGKTIDPLCMSEMMILNVKTGSLCLPKECGNWYSQIYAKLKFFLRNLELVGLKLSGHLVKIDC